MQRLSKCHSGLTQIDDVVASRDGSSYFATQGELGSPAGRNAAVDVEQVKQTPLSQSSRESMDLSRRQVPAMGVGPQQRVMQRE